MSLAYLFLSFALTAFGVWIFRKLSAGNSRLLDIPNERSSHSVPITRGAGIAIVLSILGGYVAVSGSETNVSYVLAAATIAIVSFIDDLFSVPLPIRLAIHFLAAATLVFASGSYTELSFPFSDYKLYLGPLATSITILFIVWTTNAFNFMDGIDGIAGAQGSGAAIGWILLGITGAVSAYVDLGAIVLGACVAFLLFNWQPARVFMGDVGSTFLGFTLAVFPLIEVQKSASVVGTDLAIPIILLWLFLFDTIVIRFQLAFRSGVFWKAHRDHLYQRVVRSGWPHWSVALFFGIYSILSAFTLAYASHIGLIPLAITLILGPIVLVLASRMSKPA
jgi:UDP-N-acetylmuramyl pentapeptide phosphotransferase/UDP-N-acetylglucosamine-1-phosphate transferase